MKLLRAFFIAIVLVASITASGFVPWCSATRNITVDIDTRDEVRVPILMYHKISKSKKGKYTVSPTQLRDDITALHEAGFVTVFMSEVIDWVDGKTTLPEKPIVITFDDGHYNNLYYGLPIARELGFKFMINPVTGFSKFTVDSGDHSNPNYSHVTWEQMHDAHKEGFVEFGNHTHAMHKFKPRYGIARILGECDDEYAKNLRDDVLRAQELIVGAGVSEPKTFAYPFGKYSNESRDLLLGMGFRALLTCNEWVNTVRRGEEKTLHKLGRFNRDGDYSTKRVIEKVTKTK